MEEQKRSLCTGPSRSLPSMAAQDHSLPPPCTLSSAHQPAPISVSSLGSLCTSLILRVSRIESLMCSIFCISLGRPDLTVLLQVLLSPEGACLLTELCEGFSGKHVRGRADWRAGHRWATPVSPGLAGRASPGHTSVTGSALPRLLCFTAEAPDPTRPGGEGTRRPQGRRAPR